MSNPSTPPAALAVPNGLKLNLGSGQNPKPGFINVDKFGSPDVLCDLEQFPWPWEDNAVAEIELHHVLEHLGETTALFIAIIKELYRVCADGAIIHITVPHPRCDDFLNDPTHVRIITPEVLSLFCKRLNLEWKKAGYANSPLGLYHDVNFEMINVNYELAPDWSQRMQSGGVTQEQIREIMRSQNNVIRQTKIDLKVVKTPAA